MTELDIDVDAVAAAIEAQAAELPALLARNDWGDLPFVAFDPTKEPEPIEFVWREFGPGKVSGIVAYANCAKTPFALLLAICVARGIPCLGAPTRQRKTVYIAFEGARNARRKAQRICQGLGFTLRDIASEFEIIPAPSGMLNADTAVKLCERAKSNGVGMVLIDTYGSALDGNVDRNSAAFSDCLKQLGDCSDSDGILFVVLLHCRKDGKGSLLHQIDGHNSVAGALQAAVTLSRPDENDKCRIRAHCARETDNPFEPFEIRWRDTPGAGQGGLVAELLEPAATVAKTDRAAADDTRRIKAILKYIAKLPGRTMRNIIKTVEGDERALTRLVKELDSDGILSRYDTPTSKGETLSTYSVAPPSPAVLEALGRRDLTAKDLLP